VIRTAVGAPRERAGAVPVGGGYADKDLALLMARGSHSAGRGNAEAGCAYLPGP
jgi:hypothetical protein